MPVTIPPLLTKRGLEKNKALLAKLNGPVIVKALGDLEAGYLGSPFALDVDKLAAEANGDPVVYVKRRDAAAKLYETHRKKLEAQATDATQKLTIVAKSFDKKTDKKLVAFVDEALKATKSLQFQYKPILVRETVYLLDKAFKASLHKDIAKAQALAGIPVLLSRVAKSHATVLTEMATIKKAGTIAALHGTWGNGSSAPRLLMIDVVSGWDQTILKEFPSVATKIRATKAQELLKEPWLQEMANEVQDKASTEVRYMLADSIAEKTAIARALAEYKASVDKLMTVVEDTKTAWRQLEQWA